MNRRNLLCISGLLIVLAVGGCARAARDTTDFSLVDQGTIEAPFDEAWQATKAVLREMEMDIYTRDKRGSFVAYSEMKRRRLVPQRIRYTVTLEKKSDQATAFHIETTKQVYGVTPLTYPDWHDRQTSDNSTALAILEAVQGRTS